MPWVGFEATITASERAKTVHALDREATVIGLAGADFHEVLAILNLYEQNREKNGGDDR
jgi:hypothetical protein